jgi:agmatinase
MLREPAAVKRWNRQARADAQKIIRAGGEISGRPALVRALARVNDLSGRVNDWVRGTTSDWLARGKVVGVVGGDHSVPFGAIQAYGERYPGLGILHLDAHSDTRRAYEGFRFSHASIMENVLREVPQVRRLVQVGIRDFCEAELDLVRGQRDRVQVYFDAELDRERFEGRTWAELARRIVAGLPRDVYLSWDIDGLEPTLCPHTGTPVPGGLSFGEAVALLREVVASGRRIVGFDLNEVAPGGRGDEWDANVGARLLYKMCIFTLLSQRKAEGARA